MFSLIPLAGLSFALFSQVGPPAPPPQEMDAAVLEPLASRCGSEIAWFDDWEKASEQARAQHEPILVLVRWIPGFDLPDSAMLGPFMEPEIVALVRKTFVALRFTKGMKAPFVSQKSYGMGPHTFGTSILVATPEGRIVGDTYCLETTTLYEFLCDQLTPYAKTMQPPADTPRVDRAEWALEHGQPHIAETLLAGAGTPREHLLRARLFRLQRRGQEALREIEAARKAAGKDGEAEGAYLEAVVLTRLNRPDDALAALEQISPEHADYPAALLSRGSLVMARGRVDEAKGLWAKLVNEHAESRWSWQGAAYLLFSDLLAKAAAAESDTGWPRPELVKMLERKPREVLPPDQVDRAARTARKYLLGVQRADGSWISGTEVATSVDPHRSPITVATTALCARSLLPYADEERVEDAVRRAIGFLRDARHLLDEKGQPFAPMDYFVWSKPTMLLFLADAIDYGLADREEWFPVMEKIVIELKAKQKSGGGWCYYQGGDVANLNPALDVSFSFVTAYVLLGLDSAERAGVKLPEGMADQALDCLERMSNPDGTFEYSMLHANEDAPRVPMPAGSAGRGPLCTYTLFVWAREDSTAIYKALEHFMKHRASYAKEQGKTLMHCGPEAQGSHYLMFDYAFATAAWTALPDEQRGAFREPLLDQILGARSAAGSYLDNPLIGDHYGTAMALWAFDRLRSRTE